MTERTRITGVYDDDLEILLENLGLMTKLRGGRLKCAFCSEALQVESIGGVFPDSGQIKIACDKPECFTHLLRRLEDVRYG
jgi:hypothetical protein